MQLKIPTPVRSATLSVLIRHGVLEFGLAEEFLQREGFGSFQDVVDQVRLDYGDAAADGMDEGMKEVSAREMRAMFPTKPTPTQQTAFIAQHMARWSFLYAPDPVFATVITYGIEQLERWYAEQQGPDASQRITQTVADKLNETFAKRSVPYRVDDDFEVRWYGDEATYKAIT
ncbi:MAG TPA: hypothetical protein VHX66_04090 [Solirubrobacteraceae bacterium]|jgi:hypothetical protein|nr:hypothetical protein [Solirubrobacteraceae bacterium]